MTDINKLFGERSWAALVTCHRDLQKIAIETRKICAIDFSIVEGERTVEKQLEYFLGGQSDLDPRNPDHLKSAKHIRKPSEALDFCAYVSGQPALAYDAEHCTYIAACMLTVAEFLFAKGEISHKLRWGGNWDNDGVILRDQKLWDRPHVELRKP
jgi:peptidoglycan L-alanyl-D-glutamate endopeptidase CwlK